MRKEFLQESNPREDLIDPVKEDVKAEETKPVAQEQPKIFMKPVCVSIEEMFNIINDKLDNLIGFISQLQVTEKK